MSLSLWRQVRRLRPIADVRPGDARDALVVRLPDAADHGAPPLHEEVLRKVLKSLLHYLELCYM